MKMTPNHKNEDDPKNEKDDEDDLTIKTRPKVETLKDVSHIT